MADGREVAPIADTDQTHWQALRYKSGFDARTGTAAELLPWLPFPKEDSALPSILAFSLAMMVASIVIAITNGINLWLALLGLPVAIFFVSLAALLLPSRKKCEFLISQHGLRVPDLFWVSMGMRLSRSWSDVNYIWFRMSKTSKRKPTALGIEFKSGGNLELSINGFNDADFKQLLIAMKMFVPDLQSKPPLAAIDLDISSATKNTSILSFTQMWEDELADRYASTIFVPLSSGNKLQNGRYIIRSQLTFGGSSAIYLAVDAQGDRVIVKEARLPHSVERSAKEKAIEMFEREGSLIAKLNDPRIARLIDTFVEDQQYYQVLEYINGIDLRTSVKEFGSYPEELVLRWGVEIADILVCLHAQRPPIIHRDVSPDNILERADGSLALVDFGAANEFLGTATGTVVGKQGYIAPEQFRGKATPQSDVYGLGATLYFLSTGCDPIPLSESHPRQMKSSLSADFDHLVARCTALVLSERFSSATQVHEAILGLLES